MAKFKYYPFSNKQKQLLTWWIPSSPHSDCDSVIADGSIRSGKTLIMSLSFVVWSMQTHTGRKLGMAGKTITSFYRNVWTELEPLIKLRGYHVSKVPGMADAYRIRKGKVYNDYYIFGGKDESSQDLVQGITLAGFFFDETTLMPESFVNQAVARCSIEGSKLWFNCNPQGPLHWFKANWIDKLKEKNALRLKFRLKDNPSLSKNRIKFYERMFSGVFYSRYILGLWVVAEGIIFDMFDLKKHSVKVKQRDYTKYYISIDYGIQNPTTFGLWGKYKNKWIKIKEYHYSGREEGKQKTDSQFADDLESFMKGYYTRKMVNGQEVRTNPEIIVDPSAASFIAELNSRGHIVRKANNSVLDGIRTMSSALSRKLIYYNDCCKETFKEYGTYSWDEKAAKRGEDIPKQENDHHMDADRYFVYTILRHEVSNTRPKKNYSGKGARY